MVLNRIATAIRSQSWFTVLVELLVVVVGIFLGLQVDAWSKAQQRQEEADYYLQRIIGELDEALVFLEAEINEANDLIARSTRAIEAVRNESISASNREAFATDFLAVISMPDYRPPIGTLDELQATGGMVVFDDWSVRQQLTNYRESIRLHEGQADLISEAFAISSVELMSSIDVAIDFMDSGALISPLSEINGNRPLARLMIMSQTMQIVMRNDLQRSLEETRQLRDLLVAMHSDPGLGTN